MSGPDKQGNEPSLADQVVRACKAGDLAAAKEAADQIGPALDRREDASSRLAAAHALVTLVLACAKAGDFAAAAATTDRLFEAVGRDPDAQVRRMVALALCNLGDEYSEAGDHRASTLTLEKLWDLAGASEPEVRSLAAAGLVNLALVYSKARDLQSAIAAGERLAGMLGDATDTSSQEMLARSLRNLADHYSDVGDSTSSISAGERLWRLSEDGGHPEVREQVGHGLISLAFHHYQAGNNQAARSANRRVLDQFGASPNALPSVAALALHNEVLYARKGGDGPGAIAAAERLWSEFSDSTEPEIERCVSDSQADLIVAYADRKDLAAAAQVGRRLIDRYASGDDATTRAAVARGTFNLANQQARASDLRAAIETGADLQRRYFGVEDAQVVGLVGEISRQLNDWRLALQPTRPSILGRLRGQQSSSDLDAGAISLGFESTSAQVQEAVVRRVGYHFLHRGLEVRRRGDRLDLGKGELLFSISELEWQPRGGLTVHYEIQAPSLSKRPIRQPVAFMGSPQQRVDYCVQQITDGVLAPIFRALGHDWPEDKVTVTNAHSAVSTGISTDWDFYRGLTLVYGPGDAKGAVQAADTALNREDCLGPVLMQLFADVLAHEPEPALHWWKVFYSRLANGQISGDLWVDDRRFDDAYESVRGLDFPPSDFLIFRQFGVMKPTGSLRNGEGPR